MLSQPQGVLHKESNKGAVSRHHYALRHKSNLAICGFAPTPREHSSPFARSTHLVLLATEHHLYPLVAAHNSFSLFLLLSLYYRTNMLDQSIILDYYNPNFIPLSLYPFLVSIYICCLRFWVSSFKCLFFLPKFNYSKVLFY